MHTVITTTSHNETTSTSLITESPRSEAATAPEDQENARLQNIWDEHCRNAFEPRRYKNVAALLISWDEEANDLETEKEVGRLENVLKETYKFEVNREKLHTRNDEKPQDQVHLALAKLKFKYNRPNTLMIIYYAGHGYPNRDSGQFTFFGKNDHYPGQQLSEEAAKAQLDRNTFAWENTKGIISNVEADVLLIFDCCFAGNLRERASHRYEFLAACTGTQTTSVAGDQSFTHALICALEDLAQQNRPFDTASLCVRITKVPTFPKKQYPQLFPHNEENADHIWLAPLHPEAAASPGPDEGKIKAHYLDLRFYFNNALNDREIEATATRLNNFIRDNTSILSLRRISFKRINSAEKIARDVLSRWPRPGKVLTSDLSLSSPIPGNAGNAAASSTTVTAGPTDETSTSAHGHCEELEPLLGTVQDLFSDDYARVKYHARMSLRSLFSILRNLLQFLAKKVCAF